jgi:molybdopterin/thiamine biosynthesis adenylyltransferase
MSLNGRLIFPSDAFNALRTFFLATQSEMSAACFITPTGDSDMARLLWQETVFPSAADCLVSNEWHVTLRPEFVSTTIQRAKRNDWGVVFVHSHPGDPKIPHFSSFDDKGEWHLSRFTQQRLGSTPCAAMVVSPGGVAARRLATNDQLRVVEVGERYIVASGLKQLQTLDLSKDRQIRAFGTEGQAVLENLTIGIVGVGGTGSIIAEQLAHLGVKQFILIDDDTIEATNLNRVVGAVTADIGQLKVDIASRHIRSISSQSDVQVVVGSVLEECIVKELLRCDLVFCCTDSHGSRAVLNQLAYQYFVPVIDMGLVIVATHENVSYISGRVQMLGPGNPCLTCGELLDPSEIRIDLMTSAERQRDPYIVGQREIQPAVISFNSFISSMSVNMFMAVVLNLPMKARFQLYNGVTGTVRNVDQRRYPDCIVCSSAGAFGKGDKWRLPARQCR